MIGATLTGFASVSGDQVNSADAIRAVAHVAPHAVSDLTPTTATAIGGTVAALSGGSVSLPADPAHGIRIQPTDAAGVRIGLPFAAQAHNAVLARNASVTVYDNNNGSSTIPAVHSDGTVQITTVIAEPTAPTRYDYQLAVADGATLRVADDGSVRSDGGTADAAQISVASPWARDARGQRVPTHYEVKGRTLTQVVDFTSRPNGRYTCA